MRTMMVIGGLVFLVGCAAPDNTRLTVGSGGLGDASMVVGLPAVDSPASSVSLVDDGPSIDGLDRSGWDRVTVLVPNDHTEHLVYPGSLGALTGADFAGDAYPMLESALGVEPSGGTLFLEWLGWPLREAGGVVMGVARIGSSERGLTHSPKHDGYQRVAPSEEASGVTGG